MGGLLSQCVIHTQATDIKLDELSHGRENVGSQETARMDSFMCDTRLAVPVTESWDKSMCLEEKPLCCDV